MLIPQTYFCFAIKPTKPESTGMWVTALFSLSQHSLPLFSGLIFLTATSLPRIELNSGLGFSLTAFYKL